MSFTNPDLEDITKAEVSDAEGLYFRYMIQLVLYQTMIIIQFVLIISTVVKFYRHRETKKSEKTKIKQNLRRLFILVMSLGTLVFLLVEWYGIADFLYDYAAYYKYCDVAAKLGNIFIMNYLLALYLFYLYRLYATFNKSPFELSNRLLTICLVLTGVIYLILVTAVFIFQKGETIQVWYSWSGDSADYKWITICAGEFSIGIDPILRISLEGIVVIANIFYGALFYKKLYDLLSFMESGLNPQKKDATAFSASFLADNETDIESLGRIFQLMNKQSTLVLISTVSTTLLWTVTAIAHFFDSYLQVLIYCDITINCLCLWLMFPWNDGLYRYWCISCALTTDFCCSKLTNTTRIRKFGKEIDLQNIKNGSSQKSSTRGSKQHPIVLHFHATPGHSKKSIQENSTNTQTHTDYNRNIGDVKIITSQKDEAVP